MKTTILVLAKRGRQYEVRNTGVTGVESVLHTLMTIPARLKIGLEYQITRIEGGQVTSVKTMMGKVLYQQRPRMNWWPFRKRQSLSCPTGSLVAPVVPALEVTVRHRVFDMVNARWQKKARVQVKPTRVEFFLTDDGYAFLQVDELPFWPVNREFLSDLASKEHFCAFSHGDNRVLVETKGVMRVWKSFLDLTPASC